MKSITIDRKKQKYENISGKRCEQSKTNKRNLKPDVGQSSVSISYGDGGERNKIVIVDTIGNHNDMCMMRNTDKIGLSSVEWSAENIKILACGDCGYTASHMGNLKQHIEAEHGKMFACLQRVWICCQGKE